MTQGEGTRTALQIKSGVESVVECVGSRVLRCEVPAWWAKGKLLWYRVKQAGPKFPIGPLPELGMPGAGGRLHPARACPMGAANLQSKLLYCVVLCYLTCTVLWAKIR